MTQQQTTNHHHQLRMVAAERRLQAHQEAYERCIGFIEGINFSEDAWTKLRNENERWHRKNYIFLGKKTRKSFAESLHACVRFRATRKVSDLDLSKSTSPKTANCWAGSSRAACPRCRCMRWASTM